MQDIILLQYLSKKLHTYVYKFSLNQEMLFSYCGVLSFQDSYMRNLSFRNYLLNKPQKSMPCLKAIHQKNIYCVVHTDEFIYVAGPVCFPASVYLKHK